MMCSDRSSVSSSSTPAAQCRTDRNPLADLIGKADQRILVTQDEIAASTSVTASAITKGSACGDATPLELILTRATAGCEMWADTKIEFGDGYHES